MQNVHGSNVADITCVSKQRIYSMCAWKLSTECKDYTSEKILRTALAIRLWEKGYIFPRGGRPTGGKRCILRGTQPYQHFSAPDARRNRKGVLRRGDRIKGAKRLTLLPRVDARGRAADEGLYAVPAFCLQQQSCVPRIYRKLTTRTS